MSAVPEAARRPHRWLAFLPLAAFALLAALLFVRLYAGDPSKLPSALIGESAPPLTLAGLDGAAGLADADLRQGHVSLVNVFASWCEPCRSEHPNLMALAADDDLKRQGVACTAWRRRTRPRTSAASSARSAILTPRSGSTPTDGRASTGASTACRRRSSCAATEPSPTSSSAR